MDIHKNAARGNGLTGSHPPDETGIHKISSMWGRLTAVIRLTKWASTRVQHVGQLNEQSSTCRKQASTKMQHVGKLDEE
jgi:hypothetical protein